MTKEEKIIVSAHTGILMCDFSDVHEYIEKKLGRPVYTHELADKNIWKEIKEKSKEDFLEICKQEEPERMKGKWGDTGSGEECSVCGEIQYGYDSGRRYCAWCGARMER